jgi:tetratricopeptide (TPR) repeat protein
MNSQLKQPQPNDFLRQQRRSRGWTLECAAYKLSQVCEDEPRDSKRGDINAKMIGSWERGEHLPDLYYQRKLSLLYDQPLQELGFITTGETRPGRAVERVHTSNQLSPFVSESIQLTPRQAIDQLCETPHTTLEPQSGAWLALGASDLATLFDEGWSLEEVLTALHITLQGVQAMPNISRRTFGRKLFELGTVAVVGGVSIPTGKHISAEEQIHLQQALGQNIAAGWRLFHTAGNAQVLAVGQAQLALVQHVHAILPARDRALFYSAIYDLIGKSYFFQERYEEALGAHQSAYIAALQAGDPWRITQSLICQADGYQARGHHVEAIQTIEEALRVLGTPTNEDQLRSKAHLFACWADNAMNLGEDTTVQRQLEASAAYLDRLAPNEEFDRAIWLQLAGKYALMSGDYMTALRHYEEAQAELPAHWIVRQVLVLLPMMVAYACKRDRDASLATAKKAVAALYVLNAPGLNKQFAESARRGLLDSFPNDKYVHAFLTDVQQRYPLLPMTTGLES